MKLYQYMNDKAKHKGENRLLKFTILIIGVVTLINTGVMLKALSYQRVVIMPPGLQEKTTIEGNKLDEIYVSTFVRYISSLAFSYTPAQPAGNSMNCCCTLIHPHIRRGKQHFITWPKK